MNSQNASAATIKLNLPMGILRNAKDEASRIGISLQDFLRMLVSTYFANASAMRTISQERNLYTNAMKEIKSGKYNSVNNKVELTAYLDKLDNE